MKQNRHVYGKKNKMGVADAVLIHRWGMDRAKGHGRCNG